MRYYNVYLYSECPSEQNPELIPTYWIWKTEKCQKNDSIPNNAIRMSLDDIYQYKQTNKINYNSWISGKVSVHTIVDKKVKKAIKGANDVINRVCSENIVLGITQAGKTKIIADALKDVFYYAQTGSLYECLSALDSIVITQEMSPFITQERINSMKQQIQDLLSSL